MEKLWSKGEAGLDLDSFSQSPLILEPDHFQGLFLIMGVLHSLGLIVLLWDILTNPSFGFYGLMLAGLFACLLITFANLFFFSTALWRPITREAIINMGINDGKDISTGDYEIDMEILVKHRTVAVGILGYGAVTSFIFIFVAMMRSLGKTHFLFIVQI